MPLRIRPAPFDVTATMDGVISRLASRGMAFTRSETTDPKERVVCSRPVPIRLAGSRRGTSLDHGIWGWAVLMMHGEERWLADLRSMPEGPVLNRARSGLTVRRFEVACATAEAEGTVGYVEILRIPELAVEALRIAGPPVRYVVADESDPDNANVMRARDFRKWLAPRRTALRAMAASPPAAALEDVQVEEDRR